MRNRGVCLIAYVKETPKKETSQTQKCIQAHIFFPKKHFEKYSHRATGASKSQVPLLLQEGQTKTKIKIKYYYIQ